MKLIISNFLCNKDLSLRNICNSVMYYNGYCYIILTGEVFLLSVCKYLFSTDIKTTKYEPCVSFGPI